MIGVPGCLRPSLNRVVWALSMMVLFAPEVVAPARAAETPLPDAAENADWSRVRILLKERSDANQAQADGMTALHWAAYHDETSIARLLLSAGAKATAGNRYAITPLTLACTNGNAELIRLLLKAGADPNTTILGGETVLMTAARNGRAEAVKALLDAGAKADATERSGQTALMWAAAEGHAEVIDLLIKAGADPRTRLRSGFTALHFAVREGRIPAVKALLKAGVDANEMIENRKKGTGKSSGTGISALALAVENGHFDLAAVLVKAGANPNDQRSGFTPLHILTWVRKPNRGDDPDGQPPPIGSGTMTSLQFARFLVGAGANVNTRLEKGAANRGRISMTGATAFLLASKTADLPYMKLLVELGADPLLTNQDGCTPLMAAAGLGTFAPDEEAGTEPEAMAAVEYLLGLKADINAVDKNGETAMHGAAYKSLPKMVSLLAGKGAKIDIWNRKNKYGWTPLMIAEGFRPGNFKPSAETIEAIHRVMRDAGVTPPPPTPRPVGPAPYEDPPAKKP
jgi:uncharacterized protein